MRKMAKKRITDDNEDDIIIKSVWRGRWRRRIKREGRKK